MVFLGDIDIPWVVDKSTSINRDVVEKNFVEEPPQVYELTPDLESGTYSAILHETVHARNETFTEQIDAVRSLPDRHPSELPIDLAGDAGHVAVNASSSSLTPSEEIREASLELRFLEQEDYRPAVIGTAQSFSEDFDTTPVESVIPIPSVAKDVEDEDGNSLSPEYTVETEEEEVGYYLYDTDRTVIEYSLPSDEGQVERTAPVRLYSVDGNYGQDYGNSYGGEMQRVYSDYKAFEYVTARNGLIDATPDNNVCTFWRYHASSDDWSKLGAVQLGSTDGYGEEVANYSTTVNFVDGYNLTLDRGATVAKFEQVTDTSEFEFDANNTLQNGQDNGYYYNVSDSEGNELILIRQSSDGQFDQSGGSISVDGLDKNKEYTFYVGHVLTNSVSVSDYASYVSNRGLWDRSLVQR